MEASKRRTRFEKVAANRVANALRILDSLEKCSNKNNYEYSMSDIKKMEKALKDKVADVITSFTKELEKGKETEFKFWPVTKETKKRIAKRNRQKFLQYKDSMKSPLSDLTIKQLYFLEKELDIKFDLDI